MLHCLTILGLLSLVVCSVAPMISLGAESQVHTAADVAHAPAGEHPVGQVALFVDFQHAQDGDIDPSAANHSE